MYVHYDLSITDLSIANNVFPVKSFCILEGPSPPMRERSTLGVHHFNLFHFGPKYNNEVISMKFVTYT